MPKKSLPAPDASPQPRPQVSIESVLGSGTLSPIDIRIALGPLDGPLRTCHATSLERGHDLRQTVRITMALRDGAVESIDARPALSSPLLWSCLRKTLLTARFPHAPAYAEITLSLRVGRV